MAGSSFRGPRRRGAHHPGSERPWVSRTVAISQHVPPSRYPGSTTVIPSATVADLPNRQGPCLQNSSGRTPRPPDKRLSPVAIEARKNWTFIPIQAATTRRERPDTIPREAAPALECVLREVTEGADAPPRPAHS